MAAYTPSLRLTLPVTGTDDGTWGDTVNNGITSLTDSSIAGTATVIQGDVANYTLTSNSGATDEARNMFLNITGALTAARNVICPTASKLYFIKNSTTGGFAVTLKTSGGSGISVPAGSITALYCDGTNVVDAITYANIPVINATTVDTTNLEVTNIKAKDGTASITLADTTGVASFTANPILSSGTANGVAYLNGSKVLTTGSALTFDGTGNLTCAATLTGNSFTLYTNSVDGGAQGYAGNARALFGGSPPASSLGLRGEANIIFGISSTQQMILNSSGLEVKQSQLIGYSSYAGIGTNGLAVAGNVGIGTSSPSSKLTIKQTSDYPTYGLSLVKSNTSDNWETYFAADNAYAWAYNGGTRVLALDSAGNLGLGVTPSAWDTFPALQTTGTYALSALGYSNNMYYQSGYKYMTTAAASRYEQATGVHKWFNAPAGTSGAAITFTQAMTLDASGNLGVGTTSPSSTIEAAANVSTGSFTLTTTNTSSASNTTKYSGIKFRGVDTVGSLKPSAYIQVNPEDADYVASNMAFFTRSGDAVNERMRLDATGNLGLGVTPSAWNTNFKAIELSGGANYGVSTTEYGSLQNAYFTNGGSFVYKTTATALWYQLSAGAHKWYNAPSGTAGAAITFTQAMTLNGSGNLGLGVTPNDWNGAWRVIDLQNSGAIFSSTVRTGLIVNGYNRASDNVVVYETSNYASRFNAYQSGAGFSWELAPAGTAGNAITFTQAMTLDASGNLGLGATSALTALSFPIGTAKYIGQTAPSAHLAGNAGSIGFGVSDGGGQTGIFVYNTHNGSFSSQDIRFLTAEGGVSSATERARIDYSGNLLVGQTTIRTQNSNSFDLNKGDGAIYVNHAVGSPSGNLYAAFGYSTGNIGSITQAGTTGVLYNVTSDYRLKTVIGPVADAGSRIDALQPVEYEWKSDGSRTRGFLAHKFQEVYPSSVSGTKDAVDEDGKPVYQAMQASSSEVIADLVAEIQSLRKRLTALEAK